MAGGQETGDYASKLSICAAGLMGEDLLASAVPAAVFQEPGVTCPAPLTSFRKNLRCLPGATQQREWLSNAESPGPLESRGRSKGHANELCQAVRLSECMVSWSSEGTAHLR